MNKSSVKERVNNIINKASRADQKQRLRAWSDICEKAVDENFELKIANIVTHMNNNGFKIAKSTVYNKNESNHYQSIFDVWSEYKLGCKVKIKANKSTTTNSDLDGLFNIDLNEIKSPVTKYQISILLGQLKSFKNQLDLATKVNTSSAFLNHTQDKLEHKGQALLKTYQISDYDIEIIRELLSNQLFEFDENGKMISASSIRKGTSLSSEGFKQAVEKLLTAVDEKAH